MSQTRPQLLAAFWILSAGIFHAGMVSSVHYLGGSVHPLVALFFRTAIASLFLAPFLFHHWPKFRSTLFDPGYLTRLFLNIAALGLYFWSLMLIDIAVVVAVHFTAPLFALLFQFLIQKKPVHPRSLIAILVNLAGLALIASTRPADSTAGIVLALLAAATWGGAMIAIRRLSSVDGPLIVTLNFNILATPLTGLMALPVWTTPEPRLWLPLAVIGALAVGYNAAFAKAMRAPVLEPILALDYAKVIWAALIGSVLFAESVTIIDLVGFLMISAGALYASVLDRHPFHQPGRRDVS